MQRKIVVYIAESLDGYIATKEDVLDWLEETPGEGDNGYAAFLNTVDTILMGRRTYEWLLDKLGPEGFPYREQKCYVFSHASLVPDGRVEFVQGPIRPFVEHLRVQNGKNIWLVGGSGLIDSFRAEGLIDEWIITIAPTILGDGIPLFLPRAEEERLELLDIRRYGQFAALHYKRADQPIQE